MFTPETGLKIFIPENLIYLLIHVHVPAQAINTRRPSFAIPHIFHTENKYSSNQFIYKRIIYDRVLEYIIFYRMHLHFVNAFL